MAYNVHPIIVHFPIAFLFLYSLIKILPFQKWFPAVSWKHIERLFLFIGLVSAALAYATGDTARHLTHPNRALVNAHELFAGGSLWIYGIVFFGELISMAHIYIERFVVWGGLKKILYVSERLISQRFISGLLALAGLIAITVTGLLGGVMVYGTTADPFAGIVLKLLGIQL